MDNVLYFNIAAIITCIVLEVILKAEYRKVKTTRSFVLTIVLNLNMALAMISIFLFNYSDRIGIRELEKSLKISGMYMYYILHIGICLAVFYYNYFLVRPYDKAEGKRDLPHVIPLVVVVCVLIVNVFTGCIFGLDDGLNIVYGKYRFIIYIFEMYYAIAILFGILFRHRKEIGRHKLIPSFLYVAIAIGGIVIHIEVPELQFQCFAISLGTLILVLNVQNPREIIDQETNMLNYGCFKEEIYKNINNNRNFNIMYIYFGELEAYRSIYENNVYASVLGEIGARLKMMRKNALTYRVKKDMFVVIYPQEEVSFVEDDIEYIKECFSEELNAEEKNILLNPVLLTLKYPWDVINLEDIMEDAYILQDKFRYYKGEPLDGTQVEFDRMKEKKKFEQIIDVLLKEKKLKISCIPVYRMVDNAIVFSYVGIDIKKYTKDDVNYAEFVKRCGNNENIVTIERELINMICEMLDKHSPELKGAAKICLSLSNIHFMQDGMAESIIKILRKHNVGAGCIKLGISEDLLNNMNTTIQNNIDSISTQGMSIFLQDYGVGKANLDNLTNMSVEYIEMAPGITKAVYANEKYESILRRQIEVAHKLGTKIMIGGLENVEQVIKLKSMNADYYKIND